jgi:signal transduction histidine kinase/DNA-binding response OmpR family regulator
VTRSPDKARAPNPSYNGERPASRARAPANILLVDDHPPNLTALEAILAPLGERLVRATSGSEAVVIASREELALILLDLQMPELDGFETAALLKKAERTRSVPIIMITANAPSRAMVSRGYASGAVDFLSKPLDPDVLRSKVAVFVELHTRRIRAPESSCPSPRSSLGASSAAGQEERPARLSERLIAAAPASDQAETVDALVRIHSALNEDLDLPRIAQRLVDETTSLTCASGGAFHWSARGTVHTAVSGAMRDDATVLGPGSPLVANVFGGAGALRIDDTSRQHVHGGAGAVRSALAVPVLSRGGMVAGVLVLVSDRARAFDARHEELAAVVARHAASTLENAHLYEAAEEARQRAELAELELRAGEARVRLALDSAGLGTFDYNPTTDALRVDMRSRALFGLSPTAILGNSSFLSRIRLEDRAKVVAATKRALDPRGDGSYDVEFRVGGPAEEGKRWLGARGQAFVENGRPVRFVGTLRDVTVKNEIEQERADLLVREQEAHAAADHARVRAEAASRAKDEFLATVSHELRNPLNAILGWSRVLLEEGEELPLERRQKGLEVIARNAKAQVQLVEDILEVSRIVSGKLRLSTRPTDVRSVIEASLDTVRAAAQAKGIALEAHIANDTGTIVADEDRIQQVLWNLLSNALKFTPRGGTVNLGAQRRADDVELSVRDTGEGIAQAFLPFVFDRFRQADGSTTRTHGGLGLGLAIVRHLVELHGGTVSADSAGVGKGAIFVVRLPLHAAPQTEEPPSKVIVKKAPPPEPRASPLSELHVLVLDDDEDMRDLIAMILEHAGARVTRVPTVGAALEAIVADCPHVAISDLAMPGEDGFAFVKRVRESDTEPMRSLPLIAMTAYARAEDQHRVLSAGFQRHVAKPIEPVELVEALAQVAFGAAGGPRLGARR